jgi:hypothetical protein
MSRLYLFIAGAFIAAGLAASYLAPTENMGTQEAFYAHLILLAPPLFIGTVISALAVIIRKLDLLLGKNNQIQVHQKFAEEKTEDFGALLAEKLRADHAAIKSEPKEPEMPFVFEELEVETAALEAEPQLQPLSPAPDWRAPTVDEYLEKGSKDEQPVASARLAREGTFAGRSYRMYEDGSLEIDTDQSTIRFDSLEEFRAFVSSAAKG